MAQVWKIRMPDGKIVIPGEWTAAVPLYSTVEIGTGPFVLLTAFSYGLGGSVPGSVGQRISTLVDTNLQGEGSRLPENEDILIHNIGVEIFKRGLAASVNTFPDADNPHVPLPDMLRLQRDVTLELRIAAVKKYTQSPISYWPPGTGVVSLYSGGRSFVSAGAPNGEVPANNGCPSVEGRRELASPLHIAGGETLGVDFRAGPGQVVNLNLQPDARMIFRVYLDGVRRRPVA